MLVLTHLCGASIAIDGTIRITLVAVKGNAVRVAISAPPSVRVDRQEVHDRLTAAESLPPVGGSCSLSGASV